jgi:hypothetical protein
MANLAGVVQQLRKERGQAARTLEQLDAALAALTGVSRRNTRSSSLPYTVANVVTKAACTSETLQPPQSTSVSQIAPESVSTTSLANLTLPSHSLARLKPAAVCKSCC